MIEFKLTRSKKEKKMSKKSKKSKKALRINLGHVIDVGDVLDADAAAVAVGSCPEEAGAAR